MRTVKAFGAGMGTALVCCRIMLMLSGVSDYTAAMEGAAAAVAGWSAVIVHGKA
jgi:hypothetical protein